MVIILRLYTPQIITNQAYSTVLVYGYPIKDEPSVRHGEHARRERERYRLFLSVFEIGVEQIIFAGVQFFNHLHQKITGLA